MLGLDVILIATLALFALHAIETWRPRRTEFETSKTTIEAVDCRLHEFPQVRHARTDEQDEGPTRRAA